MPQVGAFIAGAIGLGAPAIGSAAFGAYIAGVSAAGFLTSTVVGKLLTSVALSALARALQPTPRQPGITTSSTLTGGATPESFILGRYATEGQLTAPPMSHGAEGKTPNAYLTYVVELGGVPGQTLESEIIDGEPVTLGATAHPDYGLPVEGRFTGHAWVKYYDGTQAAADPMLLAKYGTASERPWLADMVGAGICYAICTSRFSRQIWSGFPKVRFVLQGIPLYDPRKDTTVGGTGAHRFADPATWEPTDNPMVMVYNLFRGIAVQGEVYGGGFPGDDLPLAEWFAAMNACDAPVLIGETETEPAYRAGLEIYVNEEPARYIDELLKSCAGVTWESGGAWKARAGAPGLPVFFFTDDDLIVDDSDDLDPHPTVGEIANAVSASYPDPASLWEPRDAPAMEDAALIALDGGRRLVSDLTFNAVPYPRQVQRLALAYLRDNRRFRRHELTLPAAASVLEPGDVVAWTSARHGYVAQEFEVARVSDPFVSSRVRLALREVSAGDWDSAPSDLIPVTDPDVTPVVPGALAVPDWTVTAVEIGPGRVGIQIGWDGDGLDGVRALSWDVRLSPSEAFVSRGQVLDVASGQALISEGILPDTDYEVRAVFVASFPVTPTAWTAVSTPVSLITPGELEDMPALTMRGRKEATAGPEQNLTPAEARTVMELGNAAQATLVASATDATAGRVLTVGAHGLGGLIPPRLNFGVTDNTIPTGLYLYDTALGSSGGPGGATRGLILHTRRAAGGGETQTYVSESGTGGAAGGAVQTRSRITGAWSAWKHAGVDSGGVAGGRWRRLQDGTQEVWLGATTSAAGEVAVTWPVAFVNTTDLRVSLGVVDAGAASISPRITNRTASGCDLSAFNSADARVVATIDIFAIGRWY